jgi:hypothetical protein
MGGGGTVARGNRSLLAPWIGGASKPHAAATQGNRSLLAPWIGGAAKPHVTATQGSRSLFAPWIGGAGTLPHVPIVIFGDGDNEGEKKRLDEKRHVDIQTAWQALLAAPQPVVREAKQIARMAIKAGTVKRPVFAALPDYRLEQLIALYRELDDEEVLIFLL